MSNASFVSPVVKDGSTLSVISPNNFCDSLAASSENSFVLCSISFLTSATVDLVSIIFGSSATIASFNCFLNGLVNLPPAETKPPAVPTAPPKDPQLLHPKQQLLRFDLNQKILVHQHLFLLFVLKHYQRQYKLLLLSHLL